MHLLFNMIFTETASLTHPRMVLSRISTLPRNGLSRPVAKQLS